MNETALVADCVKAMRDAVSIPVTVKHRIGVDQIEHYGFLAEFVDTVAAAGCTTFIVHATQRHPERPVAHGKTGNPAAEIRLCYRLKQERPSWKS